MGHMKLSDDAKYNVAYLHLHEKFGTASNGSWFGNAVESFNLLIGGRK
jgi:hypothetical protein